MVHRHRAGLSNVTEPMPSADPDPVNPSWIVRTGRMRLRPVSYADLADLVALKADPLVYAVMLGGVRTTAETAAELAEDIVFWGRHGVGIWAARAIESGRFLGQVGLHHRRDGHGIALRFAFAAATHGRGYASEAAGAALRFGHERAGLHRIVALARETNIASREVLGGIGMVVCDSFQRDGHRMLVYESVRPAAETQR
jgi:RimJ/RimL family protein N-acetyltransferase